MKPADD